MTVYSSSGHLCPGHGCLAQVEHDYDNKREDMIKSGERKEWRGDATAGRPPSAPVFRTIFNNPGYVNLVVG